MNLTEAQYRVIKNKFIWLAGRDAPDNPIFLNWWDKQDTSELEENAKKLTIAEARDFVHYLFSGDYEDARQWWIKKFEH